MPDIKFANNPNCDQQPTEAALSPLNGFPKIYNYATLIKKHLYEISDLGWKMSELGLSLASNAVLAVMLIGQYPGANAEVPAANATIGRPNCGDYSILRASKERSVFERHCGTVDETDHVAMAAALARLDPSAEARAAASRNDFRLAAVIPGRMQPPGKKRSWVIGGVECKNLAESDVVIWSRNSDVFYNPTHADMLSGMSRFSTSYNAALLSEPGFPTDRACKRAPRQ